MKKVFASLVLLALMLSVSPVAMPQSAGNLTSLNPVFRPAPLTFTATTAKTLTVSGMASIVIVTKGTFTGFTFNVLGSNDGGTTFIALPIVAGLIGGPPPGTAATQPVTAANPAAWSTNVKGLTTLQISAICTACTGTLTVQVTGQGN